MQLTPSVLTVTGWTLQSDILNKTSRAPDTITAPFAVRITAAWLNAVASLDTPVILSSIMFATSNHSLRPVSLRTKNAIHLGHFGTIGKSVQKIFLVNAFDFVDTKCKP